MLQALAAFGETKANQHQFLSRRLQQYQDPGPRSTAAALHCQACNCWVPRQPADNWQQHVKGIRHRRQLVSLRLTGHLGTMTVSLFEALPGKVTAAACHQGCTSLRWQEQRAAIFQQTTELRHALEIAAPLQPILVHLEEHSGSCQSCCLIHSQGEVLLQQNHLLSQAGL